MEDLIRLDSYPVQTTLRILLQDKNIIWATDSYASFGEAYPDGKGWKDYIDSKRLEITCGEAPYLVSRYDASTGEMIDIHKRIGILDLNWGNAVSPIQAL